MNEQRAFRIINRLRLLVDCPDCGAPANTECYPEYGCDNLLRAEAAIEKLFYLTAATKQL